MVRSVTIARPIPIRLGSGPFSGEERPERLEGDVGGQQVEACADELLGAPLRAFRGSAGDGEAPQEDDPGDRLDEGIRSEADEGYGARGETGADGYGGLDSVPTDPEPREEFDPSNEPRSLGRPRRLAGPESDRRAARERAPAFSISTAESSEQPASVSEYMTSLPSRRELTSPLERKTRRWCETRFWARSEIQARSHTQSSPPSSRAAASMSRVGSESARAARQPPQ
jgi:hypothetical protein